MDTEDKVMAAWGILVLQLIALSFGLIVLEVVMNHLPVISFFTKVSP